MPSKPTPTECGHWKEVLDVTRRRDGRPIWAAYNDTQALTIDCPHCTAQTGQWCTRTDGRVRRTPCLDRITITAPTAHDFDMPRRTEAQ
jgi:hypothetical protein